MSSEPFLGEIRLFAGRYPPRGWALCEGQYMPVAQNTALFSLLGITYGGDGTRTFALPDLRNRFPMGAGQGPGLTDRRFGETPGAATVTLTPAEMPAHAHQVGTATAGPALGRSPAGTLLARGDVERFAPPDAGPNVEMGSAMLSEAGGGQPHENRQPFLPLNFIIAIQGLYPARP